MNMEAKFRKATLGGALLAVAFAWTMNAAPAAAEHLVVPLSDPAKPAELEVSLVMGSIKVSGGTGREVVVEAQSRAEDEDDKRKGRDLPGDRAGMRRIPNTAIGLEALLTSCTTPKPPAPEAWLMTTCAWAWTPRRVSVMTAMTCGSV